MVPPVRQVAGRGTCQGGKIMKRKLMGISLAVMMIISAVTGCGSSSGSQNSGGGTNTTADQQVSENGKEETAQTGSEQAAADGRVNLVLWFGLSGQAGEIVQQAIRNYNDSQDKVYVEVQYQGSYEESLNKLKTAMRTKAGPDLVQIYEAGTRTMIDSGFVIPMQTIIDEYDIDVSGLEENLLNYYVVDGKLYSMPLNTSVPVCYYNKTVLSQIGYEDGPKSWDDITDISEKVIAKGLAESGIALCSNLAWCFEQPMVQQRYPMVDNDNGRSGRATRSTLADGTLAVEIASKFQELVDKGYTANVGFTVEDNRAAFWSGSAAVMIDSSGSIRASLEAIDGAYELGVCEFPGLTADAPNGGVTLGGASIYVCDNGKGDEKNEAIADFMKYLITPETQGYIFANTGYFPITSAALEQEEVKETMKEYPQYQVVIDTVHNSPNMGFGALYASLVDGRAIYVDYLQRMFLGEVTPEECIQKSADEINALIEEYNEIN